MARLFLGCVTVSEEKNSKRQATVWWVIFGGAKFRGKSEKALRINFRGF
jgi:hypothetical protein